jgi:hypothetical protein
MKAPEKHFPTFADATETQSRKQPPSSETSPYSPCTGSNGTAAGGRPWSSHCSGARRWWPVNDPVRQCAPALKVSSLPPVLLAAYPRAARDVRRPTTPAWPAEPPVPTQPAGRHLGHTADTTRPGRLGAGFLEGPIDRHHLMRLGPVERIAFHFRRVGDLRYRPAVAVLGHHLDSDVDRHIRRRARGVGILAAVPGLLPRRLVRAAVGLDGPFVLVGDCCGVSGGVIVAALLARRVAAIYPGVAGMRCISKRFIKQLTRSGIVAADADPSDGIGARGPLRV